MARQVALWIALLLLAAGLAVSEYLLLRALLLAAELPEDRDWCSAVFGRGCDDALQDPASRIAGIPFAGWGVIYFGSVLLLLLLGWALDGFRNVAALASFAVGACAAAASAVLAVGILGGLLPGCPLCLVVHGINLTLLPLFWRSARAPLREKLAACRAVEIRSSARAPAWSHVAGGSALSLGIFAALFLWVSHTWREASHVDPAKVLASHASTPRVEIPVGDDDPRLGPADATVRLILFSDFQCPACREFARALPGLLQKFPDRVAVYFKHYPLSSRCHPRLKVDMHPGSCEAAWAAEAARRQGGFWKFHDRLFAAHGAINDALLGAVAAESGLDSARFEADLRDLGVRARVAADLELGTELGVDGTPSVFLNGRRVRDLRPAALTLLIAAELRESSE